MEMFGLLHKIIIVTMVTITDSFPALAARAKLSLKHQTVR